MSNAQDVKVTETIIRLDGQDYSIKYDLNAFIVLEDRYDSIDGAMDALNKGSMKAMRTLLWAGFRRFHPEVSEEDIGRMLDPRTMADAAEVVNEAMAKALPKKEGKDTEAGGPKNQPEPVKQDKTTGTGPG